MMTTALVLPLLPLTSVTVTRLESEKSDSFILGFHLTRRGVLSWERLKDITWGGSDRDSLWANPRARG